MNTFEFTYDGEEYKIGEENFTYLVNEDVEDFGLNEIINILNDGKEEVDFDFAYYDEGCPECGGGKQVDKKHYGFLEYHFYIFTKNDKYIMSSISSEFKDTSFTRLVNTGKVDNSFIVSIIYCTQCNTYSMELEQCEM